MTDYFSIGLALLFGMIFYYMKYKSLQKHYRSMDDPHCEMEEDEMKVYHGDMQAGNMLNERFWEFFRVMPRASTR